MSDLIKREDAIKALRERWARTISYDGIGEDIGEESEDVIKAVPSADRPQGWIPCSERMPNKENATYLVCTDYGYMCSCRWTNDIYGLGATKWSEWGWCRIDLPQYSKVVAWMPLKPWKGADDEMR